jgi:hypothetical protein
MFRMTTDRVADHAGPTFLAIAGVWVSATLFISTLSMIG